METDIAALRGRTTVTVEEAGAYLAIGRTLAYEAARAGDLPVIRIGRRVLVSAPALLRMIEGEAFLRDGRGSAGV